MGKGLEDGGGITELWEFAETAVSSNLHLSHPITSNRTSSGGEDPRTPRREGIISAGGARLHPAFPFHAFEDPDLPGQQWDGT